MIGEKTTLELPLILDVTTEPFSVSGPWRVQTFGFWVGDLILETREDEGDRWRSAQRFSSYGEIHPFDPTNPIHDEHGTADATGSVGRHTFYRFVFKRASINPFLHVRGKEPKLVFSAETLIFDP